jgi:hypothetical protein
MIIPHSPPLSAGSGALAGGPLMGVFPHFPAGIVLGAFAGAVVFVVSAHDLSFAQKTLLFGASLAAGVLAAPFTATVISALTPTLIVAPPEVGALVASSMAVRLLLALSVHSNGLLRKWSGGGKA